RRATGDGRRATGDGRRATGDGRRATGDGRRATGDKRILLAARSAVALHRLLDTLPVFTGDHRITRLFTLVPGSDFDVDALSAIDAMGGRTVPWDEACEEEFDLILSASPKGELRALKGKRILLPHGAGFNKSIQGEGTADSASGLDPAYLLPNPEAEGVTLHALAHPDQVSRLAAMSPSAAERARVVGDPTLDRLLESWPLRDGYREALGTGPRHLVVMASTWGPESLLRRWPELPRELAAQLPCDEYQLALIVHPNEWALLGTYNLSEHLEPALEAGLILAAPYEEWASVLIAGDSLVTDHGSSALYYAATRDRPVVTSHRDYDELIPGTPMDHLLNDAPLLKSASALHEVLGSYAAGGGRRAAQAAFACPGEGLSHLRTEAYGLLGLEPPSLPVRPRALPSPTLGRTPAAFDVHAELLIDGVRITRKPAFLGPPGHHLAVEHGVAGERPSRSAGLLCKRAATDEATRREASWTAGGWMGHVFAEYPNCRVASVILSREECLVRLRDLENPYAVRVAAWSDGERVVHADPMAASSAAYAWLVAHPEPLRDLTPVECLIGCHTFRMTIGPAAADALSHKV
ncbi:hypothetical protein ABZ832_17135, partial [Streptantibioticus parmotrematis]|uniref:hypothetical protein n=1 Tax=Streptantibioticus parmotrematis TaxID=2873249 RepID=UPI00340248D7